MIDAKAVVADLDSFGALQGAGRVAGGEEAWLQEALKGVAVEYGSDAAAGRFVLLPGASARSVVLGTSTSASTELGARLSLITGVETLKALARRFGAELPCSVRLQLWSGGGRSEKVQDISRSSGETAAYLELQMEPDAELATAGKALGMAKASEADGGRRLNPRLTALGAEAIEELTGEAVSLSAEPQGGAAVMADQGTPTAVMYVQAFAGDTEGSLSDAARLHVLQAAESFGRWAEATVHLVAGDGVDLWALEHRVPRS